MKWLYEEQSMRWNNFRILGYFIIAAIIAGIAGWIMFPAEVLWFVPAIVLGLILIGLGVNSLVLSYRTDSKISAIDGTLKHIEELQEAIKNEQEKQASAHTPIVTTLQAFSQLYMDSLASRQSEEEQQNSTDDT
jgi:sulfite exporter TauE/SafE